MALSLFAGALFAGGCGGDETPDASGEQPVAAPSASAFPKANGDIDKMIDEIGATNAVVASPSGFIFEPGKSRLGFALFDVSGPQITGADVAVYVQRSAGAELQGPYPAREESLDVQSAFRAESAQETDATNVYVADVPFDKPGDWRAVAAVRDVNGELRATNFTGTLKVSDYPDIPDSGEAAPDVSTPTLDDVDDVSEIDTRVPASTMHTDDLADVLGKEPVVLLFATPRLCQSRVCGPVVDVAEQVKAEYGDEAAFIHMEIWRDNVFAPNDPDALRPQVQEYGLVTEPWLFVIDEQGQVSTRIEGAFSVAELEQALAEVSAGSDA